MLTTILTFALTHWILLTYITGVIVMYTVMRTIFDINEHTWGDLTLRLIVALFSWMALILILGLAILNLVPDNELDAEPPRWLRI